MCIRDRCYGCSWHPNGNFLAAAVFSSTGTVRVYSWNGTDTLALVETLSITDEVIYVDWHPSGDYLAVNTYNTGASIKVYSWNGTDTLQEVETLSTGSAAYVCSWSHDGNFLAVGSSLANKAIVCLLYTSPSPRDGLLSRMPSSA